MVPALDRRKMLLGTLFAIGAGVAFAREPREHVDYLGNGKLETLIPETFGRWQFATTSGLVVPPEDALSEALYAQLLTRVYVDGANPPVMLLIAQSSGQTGMLQVHRPEFCYPAAGYQLSPTTPRLIATQDGTVKAGQLTATSPQRSEQILYWTRIGDSMPSTWAQQRLEVARQNLEGVIPDAVLVRVSTVDPDAMSASARLAEFVEGMVAGMRRGSRRVLVA